MGTAQMSQVPGREAPTRQQGECRACALGRRIGGIALQLVGSLVVSFVLTSALRLGAGGLQSTAFFTNGCPGCPSDLALTSAAVEARPGSTLFVIGGTWPQSMGSLHTDVRLQANDLDIVLAPHVGPDGFAVVRATEAGKPLPLDAIAAGVQPGYFVLDVSDALLQAPVEFSFGLWKDEQYMGRIPVAGMLRWSGAGAPQLAAASAPATALQGAASLASARPAPSAPATVAATASPSAPVDPTVLAGACVSTTSGSVPPYLVMDKVGSGTDPDPRTQIPTRWVGAAGSGSIPAGARPALSFVAILSRAGQPNGAGPRIIDRLGSLQLWAYWDGSSMHKGIRTFAGGTWQLLVDTQADALTADLHANGIALFWAGLRAGDRYGFVSSSASGCRPVALDAGGTPLETVP